MPTDKPTAPHTFSATPKPDPRDAWIEARARLEALHKAHGDKGVLLSGKDAAALLRGFPPDPELHDSHARFSAKFVPFLRHGMDADPLRYRGVIVTPHPDGGAVLASTNHHVLLLAYDPTARVSKDGCRVVMPEVALDACEPPPVTTIYSEGEVLDEVPPQPWTVPDRVICVGASLLVGAKEPPPGLPPGAGAMLYEGMVETGRYWHADDARRTDVVTWWRVARELERNREQTPLVLGAQVLLAVSAAMAASGVRFWHVADIGRAVALRPAIDPPGAKMPPQPDNLAIIAMKGGPFVASPPTPAWLDSCIAAHPEWADTYKGGGEA